MARTYSLSRRLSVLSLAVAFLPAAAQQRTVLAPHKPISPRITNGKVRGDSVPRSMIGGLWMTDPNTNATLYLKNNVEVSAIAVTPVLHLSNGAQYALPAVNLDPGGTTQISINDGLQSQGIASYAPLNGYVELRYNWPWDALCATIRNIDTIHSTIFMYSVPSIPPVDPAQAAAKPAVQTMEGLWWKQEANVSGFVSLLNTSSQPISVSLQLVDDTNKVFATHTSVVSPQGMKTVDLEELLTATSTVGGIQVTFTGQKSDLQIYGGLQDRSVGYSAKLLVVPVPDASAEQKSLTVAELGLMAGAADPMMSFPVGTTFTPYSVLRNTSDAPISVTPTLWWMQGGASHSAPSQAITLLPHQSRSLDVMSLISSSGLKNFNGTVNLMLDVQGKTAGLIAVAGSVDQTNSYVFEVAPKGVVESASRSLSYWSTGNGDDTMVTLWNPADEAQDFSFKLLYAGGHYAYPIHLGPRDSRTFNISEVIHSQIPDAEGNTVPVTVEEGSATISGSQADNQHILVVMDAGTYNVKKATCGLYCQSCDGLERFWFELTSFTVGVNQVQREYLKDQWFSGQQHDLSSNSTWSSSNTSRATVSVGNVTGVGPGSVTIGANLTSTEPVGAQNVCEGGIWTCPLSFTNVGGSGGGTVTPTISQDRLLWYFNGNPTPSGFTLGSTSATLTASGGGDGTYGWSITNGSSKAALQGTTSGSNITSVQITSSSYSTSANDVTVQLQFQPSNGNGSVQTTYNLTVDSPYKLVSNGATTTRGIQGSCLAVPAASGTAGFQTLIPYAIISFQGVQISNISVFENFSNYQSIYTNENWGSFTASGITTLDGTFVDDICRDGSGLTPQPLPPQSPLSSVAVDQMFQTWNVGSGSAGAGLSVQTDTLRRYVDHGVHTGITSPTR